MTRTFLDSGVLLTAWRGKECCEQALAVMEDERREFCTAQLVKLERAVHNVRRSSRCHPATCTRPSRNWTQVVPLG